MVSSPTVRRCACCAPEEGASPKQCIRCHPDELYRRLRTPTEARERKTAVCISKNGMTWLSTSSLKGSPTTTSLHGMPTTSSGGSLLQTSASADLLRLAQPWASAERLPHSMGRAMQRASRFAQHLPAPAHSPLPRRLDPLSHPISGWDLDQFEEVALSRRPSNTSRSRARLMTSPPSRPSLMTVPIYTTHKGGRPTPRPTARSTTNRRPWEPPRLSACLHLGPLRSPEYYAEVTGERALVQDLTYVTERSAATTLQAARRGALSRKSVREMQLVQAKILAKEFVSPILDEPLQAPSSHASSPGGSPTALQTLQLWSPANNQS